MQRIIAIACIEEKSRAIGTKGGKLLWRIPEDLKRFKALTKDCTVVMGRKTFESIGKPLPNRHNIILTREKGYRQEGCVACHSTEEAFSAARTHSSNNIFIIGGGEIYELFLPETDELYLTVVRDEDFTPSSEHVFFPDFSHFAPIKEKSEWAQVPDSRATYRYENFFCRRH